MMDKTDHIRSLNYSTQALEQLEVCLPLLSQDLTGIRAARASAAGACSTAGRADGVGTARDG